MRIAVSLTEQRKSKAHLRKQMKNYKIKVKDVAEVVSYHINTVKTALNQNHPHWNQEVIQKGWELVDQKKALEPAEK